MRIRSDIVIQPPFQRSSSDRSIHRRSQDNDENQFDLNNQSKSNSLSTITSKRPRSIYINQRTFVPLPPTDENHSQINNNEE